MRCSGAFSAHVSNLRVTFRWNEALNTVLEVGKAGGRGYLRDLIVDDSFVNEPGKEHLKYLR